MVNHHPLGLGVRVKFSSNRTTIMVGRASYLANLQLVGDYINTIQTSFDFKFDLYQAVKQLDTQKLRSQEKLSIIKAPLSLLVNL